MFKRSFWITWCVLSLSLLGYFLWTLLYKENKTEFLIGETTYGHYQIEMACATCHTDPFGGKEVLQNACTACHAEELEAAHDSHPKSKFTDPREAYRLKILDARYCITCHTEHKPEQTGAMGVTLPGDYCFHCHNEVVKERESHKNLPFDSCASAGCHNFHDNRALYESFLVEHANQPWLKSDPHIPLANNAFWNAALKTIEANQLPSDSSQIVRANAASKDIPHDWLGSAHQKVGVTCANCHQQNDSADWIDRPSIQQCQTCHGSEASSYLQGKHGMRLAINSSQKLIPITPGESQKKFNESSLDIQHGCNTCHGAHSFDTKKAAVDACLVCHNDEHSRSYETSRHFSLLKSEAAGSLPQGSGVSCATCHMPRIDAGKVGTVIAQPNVEEILALHISKDMNSVKEVITRVQHNQNWNLRPNEKMIRSVCMDCHSLEFSIDALADDSLIKANFSGKPSKHIESIDWAVARDVSVEN